MFYLANSTKSSFTLPGRHDPDTIRELGLMFKPPTWVASSVYRNLDADNYDIVLPTEYTGVYYQVETTGKSGAVEPTWIMTVDELTVDGAKGLTWKAHVNDLMPPTESIVASLGVETTTVTATNGALIKSFTLDVGSVTFVVDNVPPNTIARSLKTFDVVTHAVKNNGETIDVTITFLLGEH